MNDARNRMKHYCSELSDSSLDVDVVVRLLDVDEVTVLRGDAFDM